MFIVCNRLVFNHFGEARGEEEVMTKDSTLESIINYFKQRGVAKDVIARFGLERCPEFLSHQGDGCCFRLSRIGSSTGLLYHLKN